MRGIALDGFDEIRNQIVTALELHVDVRPGVVALNFEADQAVVHADEKKDQEHEDAQNNQTGHRKTSRVGVNTNSVLRQYTWGGHGCKANRRALNEAK